MGRGKRKRKAKIKAKRVLKIKSGKLVRFVLSNSPKKYNGWRNKYNYQSNIHNLIYKGATFENDKFQNCIITSCNFRNTRLNGVDFAHCNLKGTSFKNANLSNVTFFDCKLASTDFENATMNNVVFMRMNIDKAKNLPARGYSLINSYHIISNQRILQNVSLLSNYKELERYHILNIKKDKPNNWYLNLLLSSFDNEDDVSRAIYALTKRRDKQNFITIYAYKRFVDNYLKI